MKAFLDQVARHYFAGENVAGKCFIFPNRRAIAFFRKFFGECVARSGEAVEAPLFYTMNDFFYQIAGASQTDQLNQLLVLYECYCKLNPLHESLDDFIFWGAVLLSDFNDVDKYLVRPDGLFTNVAEFRGIQGSFEWLDDTQREAILAFVGHFKTGGCYKEEFRKIWDIMLPLYNDFNARLMERGFSYEGMIYRQLAQRLREESVVDVLSGKFSKVDKFVFVGLNALNECEKLLMRRLRDAHLAEFCWDYSSEWIKDPHNRSSFFLSRNVEDFPQAFKPDQDGLGKPSFSTVSVPSSIGQAKQLPAIFERLGTVGIETAVVLPDESLLIPVLNSIPESIQDINVTMGYPMKGSGLWSFMKDVAALQLHLREKDGKWYFYYKQVQELFSNSVFKIAVGEDCAAKATQLRKEGMYYVPRDFFSGNPVLEQVFRPIVTNPSLTDPDIIVAIEDYQCSLVSLVASCLKSVPDMAIELDFAREYYLAIGRLRSCNLPVLPATYFHLLDSLVGRAAIPFKGEPLKGLQIMGPLETRALDFDNIVILSCNEGIFPRRNVGSSFIPQELRRGFDLPTYEYQDAVWAYYFYRMVQRARNVWMLFDSRTEGVRCGEVSRYVKQLELHFGVHIDQYVAKSPILRNEQEDTIFKTLEDIETIRGKCLSASSMQNYLCCQAKFYYHTVLGLNAQDEIEESLDSGGMGTVFHNSMQELYTVPDGILRREYLQSLLRGSAVKEKVRAKIMEQLHTFEVSGKNIIFEDMVCRYVRKTIQRDIELMDRYGKNIIRILGLELERYATIHGFRFYGRIDRLDSIEPGIVRVVDYKTGRVTDDDFIINERNVAEVVGNLFGSDNKKRSKIALQLYLYDILAASDPAVAGLQMVNSIYQPSRLFLKDVEEVSLNSTFNELVDEGLKNVLEEIMDLDKSFERNGDENTCKWCDFKTICGR